MSIKPVFQLSILSQNDSGAADGSDLVCVVTNANNGILRSGSFPLKENVNLPIPPKPGQATPPTPTWFLKPNRPISKTSYNLELFCPTDSSYPRLFIEITESDVKDMLTIPLENRKNKIYQKGEYGVIGFATEGANGPIYTITAGVLDPKLQGNEYVTL